MTNRAIEIVTFSLQPGAKEAAFMEAAAATCTFLRAQKGFQARRLSRGPDGTFTDHVEWASRADAEAAAAAFMQQPALVPFMQMIDPTTMSMGHNDLLVSVDGG